MRIYISYRLKNEINFFECNFFITFTISKEISMKKLVNLTALLILIPILGFSQLDFTVKYVKHIKGYPVFEVRRHNHFLEMNKTRKDNGALELEESDSLNEVALERGIFALENFDYFNLNNHNGFNPHTGSGTRGENYGDVYQGGGIRVESLGGVDEDFVKSRINSDSDYYKRNPEFVSMLYNKGERYNNSEGHFNNRINKKYTEYGNCFLVTFIPVNNPGYDPNGKGIQRKTIPKMVMIHYEVFE